MYTYKDKAMDYLLFVSVDVMLLGCITFIEATDSNYSNHTVKIFSEAGVLHFMEFIEKVR